MILLSAHVPFILFLLLFFGCRIPISCCRLMFPFFSKKKIVAIAGYQRVVNATRDEFAVDDDDDAFFEQ